jgi:hypothetical protein
MQLVVKQKPRPGVEALASVGRAARAIASARSPTVLAVHRSSVHRDGVPLYVDEDDITSEWATLKGLSACKNLAPEVNLRDEFLDATPHPEFVYKISGGAYLGLAYATLWRFKCLGMKTYQKRVSIHKDFWIVKADAALWRGEKAETPPKKGYIGFDMTQVLRLVKTECATNLDEARMLFARFRDEDVARHRKDQGYWRAQIEERQAEIARSEAVVAKYENFLPEALTGHRRGSGVPKR